MYARRAKDYEGRQTGCRRRQIRARGAVAEAAGSCRVKCLNGEKVARRLEGDAVVGSRSETWQRRELCCSKKESRVSCRGFWRSKSGLASNLHAFVSCSWDRSSAGDRTDEAQRDLGQFSRVWSVSLKTTRRCGLIRRGRDATGGGGWLRGARD